MKQSISLNLSVKLDVLLVDGGFFGRMILSLAKWIDFSLTAIAISVPRVEFNQFWPLRVAITRYVNWFVNKLWESYSSSISLVINLVIEYDMPCIHFLNFIPFDIERSNNNAAEWNGSDLFYIAKWILCQLNKIQTK